MICPKAICTITFYVPNAKFICKKKLTNMSWAQMVVYGYSKAFEMQNEINTFKNVPFSVDLEIIKKA